ncbi:hypothetical protein AB0P07_11845 [Streptomyces sp. NPDC085944]|uniref:hypothetical protein n=1 Tax=Streptomyces sp. NPDC085944 TaxID=3154962 RepID=UPI00342E3E51
MDSGDLATWVGSSFAAVAAGATLWTLKSQRDQIGEQRQFIAEQSENLALERAELRAAALARREAQAKQVYMYHRTGNSEWGDDDATSDCWLVSVRNDSDAPVHALDVRFGETYLAAEVYDIPPTAVRGPNHGTRRARPVELLGPRRAVRFDSQEWPRAVAHNHRPTLFFTDDGGVRWSLDWQGKLEEVPPGQQAE